MKVLIVDDEYYFRQAIKNMLKESGLDLTLCGEARDGQTGLELFRSELPEIVLADINMPLTDGLSFIREAKELHPHTRFIILTGFDSFEYAKKAISLGVKNYLLKPIVQEEFNDTLHSAIGEILSESRMERELQQLQDLSRRDGRKQRERIIHDLLMGDRDYGGKRQQEEMARYGLFFDHEVFAAACLLLQDESCMEQISDELLDAAENETRLAPLVGEPINFCVSGVRDGKIGIILNFGEHGSWRDSITKLMNVFLAKIAPCAGNIAYGVGTCYFGLQKVYLSFHEAQQMCYQHQLYDSPQIFFERGDADTARRQLWTEEKRVMLAAYHNIGNYKNIELILSELQREAEKFCLSRSELILLVVEVLAPCFQYAQRNNQDEVLQNYLEFIIRKLQTRRTTEQIFDYVRSAYRDSIRSMGKNPAKKRTDTISRTLQYINENYTDSDLVIEQIAKAVFINSSYLCCIFKKEVGVTINRYIMQIRLMNAKERMDRGEMYVRRIAMDSGFSDSGYFGKCFRSEFMITPSEYIRTVQTKDE